MVSTRSTRHAEQGSSAQSPHKEGESSEPSGTYARGGFRRVSSDESDEDIPPSGEEGERVEEREQFVKKMLSISGWVFVVLNAAALTPIGEWGLSSWGIPVVRRLAPNFVTLFWGFCWLFQGTYCQYIQRQITGEWANSKYRVKRFMYKLRSTSESFYGTEHGAETPWSLAISVFCLNCFIANAMRMFMLFIQGMFFVNDDEIVGFVNVCCCMVGVQWGIFIVNIKPQQVMPRGPVKFSESDRVLQISHTRCSDAISWLVLKMIIGTVFVLGHLNDFLRRCLSILMWIQERDEIQLWFKKSVRRDELSSNSVFCTVAILSKLAIDGLYYCWRIYVNEDPMHALTQRKGTNSLEVNNVLFLMAGMLSDIPLYISVCVCMSDDVKRAYLAMELYVQVCSMGVLAIVSYNAERYGLVELRMKNESQRKNTIDACLKIIMIIMHGLAVFSSPRFSFLVFFVPSVFTLVVYQYLNAMLREKVC